MKQTVKNLFFETNSCLIEISEFNIPKKMVLLDSHEEFVAHRSQEGKKSRVDEEAIQSISDAMGRNHGSHE